MTTINKQLNELMVWAPRVEMSDVVLRMLKRGALFYNDVKRSAHAANRVLDIIDELSVERAYQENAKGYAAGKKVATTQLWTSVRHWIFSTFPHPDATNILRDLMPVFEGQTMASEAKPEECISARLFGRAEGARASEERIAQLENALLHAQADNKQKDQDNGYLHTLISNMRDANNRLCEHEAQVNEQVTKLHNANCVLLRERDEARRDSFLSCTERDEARAKVTQLLLREQEAQAAIRRQEHITADEVRRYERLSTEVRHLFDARTQIDIMRSLNGVRAVLGIE